MNYLESIAYLESLSPTLEKPTVERIKLFLNLHGNPQSDFKTVHVGGTNGKGSTVAVIDSVLRATGLRIGRFTGPHLLRWNERFHVDGKPIADDQFAYYASALRELSESFAGQNPEIGKLTWFEFITALALFYFRDEKIDAAVLEVGLGGRFDATNVLGDNLLGSIITNMHILGATEELIAFEKAGIIMPGKPVVTAATGGALKVILARAAQVGAPIVCLDSGKTSTSSTSSTSTTSDALIDSMSVYQNHARTGYSTDRLRDSLKIALQKAQFDQMPGPLMGEHQRLNALLAFIALYLSETDVFAGPKLTDTPVLTSVWSAGMKTVYWPGRMQRISPQIILDGAHNPGGARALRLALDDHFPNKRTVFVLSCFDNKDAGGILQSLFKPGDRVFLCEAATRRATFPKDKLLQMAREMDAEAEIFDSIALAYQAALKVAGADYLVVATGSFATVRECMQEIGWQSVDDGRGKSGKIDSAESVLGNKLG
jgi:dihydrofolate synthase / folylpolyglutamate synthase